MQVNVSSPNSFTRELKIKVPWEELQDDFNKAAKSFSKRIKMPGFRPGKVPVKKLMSMYLSDIEAHFIDSHLNDYYLKALQQENIVPVNRATVDDIEFGYEKPLSFITKAEVEPEIKLPKLRKRSFKIEKNIYEPDEEDMNAAMDELRKSKMEVQTVEDGAKTGDFVIADFQKLDESGLPIIGEKLDQRFLKIGEDPFTGENESKVLGAKREDAIRVQLPTDQSGNTAPYELKVLNVERQVLPEVDLEFAKSIDPDCESLEAFTENIRKKIEENYERRSNEELERTLSDALIEKVNTDYPPSMVDSYLDHMVTELKGEANRELDEEKVRDVYRPIAERNLQWFLIRKALIQDQEFEVTKEELDKNLDEAIKRNPDHKKELQQYYKKPSNRQRIEDDLMEKKILDYLKEFAKIKEVQVATKTLRERASEENT